MSSDDTDVELNLTDEEMISMAMGQTVEREIAGQIEGISITSSRFQLTTIQARLIGEALSQFEPTSAVDSEVAHRTQSRLLQESDEQPDHPALPLFGSVTEYESARSSQSFTDRLEETAVTDRLSATPQPQWS